MAAKRKTPFTKVILNVPTSLLEKFDFAAKTNDYSRSEAVKEAMRIFVIDQMGEDWIPQNQMKEYQEQMKAQWAGMMQGMAEGVQNLPPEMQQQQYPNLSVNDTTTKERSSSRKRRASKRQKLSDVYKKGK